MGRPEAIKIHRDLHIGQWTWLIQITRKQNKMIPVVTTRYGQRITSIANQRIASFVAYFAMSGLNTQWWWCGAAWAFTGMSQARRCTIPCSREIEMNRQEYMYPTTHAMSTAAQDHTSDRCKAHRKDPIVTPASSVNPAQAKPPRPLRPNSKIHNNRKTRLYGPQPTTSRYIDAMEPDQK